MRDLPRKLACRGLEEMEDGNGSLDLGKAEASYYLGDLLPEEMPGIALRALEAGYYGPALLELARMSKPPAPNAGSLFERALGEMRRPLLPKDKAGLRVARNIARKITSGELPPYEGARMIWTEVWNKCGRPDELTPFVGLASLYEADSEHRPLHLREIVARAEELANEREDD